MTKEHACPYCGQMQMIVLGGSISDFEPRELDNLAAEHCDCDEALAYQNKTHMTTYAEAAIKDFFKDDSDGVRQFLLDCLPKLADWTVEKISINLEEGVKAVLTRKEGSIRVERATTIKKVKA